MIGEFPEQRGVTTHTTLIVYGSKAERDAALSTGMTDGMEMSYQLLDGMLAELSSPAGRQSSVA